MAIIHLEHLQTHRTRTFNLPPHRPLSTSKQAQRFLEARGFIFFWPVKGIDLPSLWTAVAGDRPVAAQHDDPGHITWSWKDDALGKKRWYYAKILHRKATLISLADLPYFYALSANYGSPEEDYLLAYREGRLTQAAKQIYEALLEHGPLHSIELRHAAKLSNARDSEYHRGLEDLQADFKILPVGIAEAGAWRYAYIYDLTHRHFPDLIDRARSISEAAARQKLEVRYLDSVGATQLPHLTRLFGWSNELVEQTLHHLILEGRIIQAAHPQHPGTWLTLPSLIE